MRYNIRTRRVKTTASYPLPSRKHICCSGRSFALGAGISLLLGHDALRSPANPNVSLSGGVMRVSWALNLLMWQMREKGGVITMTLFWLDYLASL